jgi:hypothetical protein
MFTKEVSKELSKYIQISQSSENDVMPINQYEDMIDFIDDGHEEE